MEADALDTVCELRSWAIECQIADLHLDKLLKILKKSVLPQLPLSSKTFLKTASVEFNIESIPDADESSQGEFVYLGMEEAISAVVDPKVHYGDAIELQFNMDGVSLFKSSSKGLWPILGKIFHRPDIYEPFAIAIYCGNSKPKDLESYLGKFIHELNHLQSHGIKIDDKQFSVRVHCIICDTPARSFIKGTKYNGGFYACERCTVKGEKVNGTTVYRFNDGVKRTDDSFRQFSQPDHHRKPTPLISISPKIDMVHSFILDKMHLIDLGVTKKELDYWFNGERGLRLGVNARDEISARMVQLRNQLPAEYTRKPRSLKYFSEFKAAEFHCSRNTIGPIVFKGIVPINQYNHFLLIHAACRILSNESLIRTHKEHARAYLAYYCLSYEELYSETSMTINPHNVAHLIDDIEFTGCTLNEINAYCFETFQAKANRYIRSGHRPLSQFCRRYLSETLITRRKAFIPPELEILKEFENKISRMKFKGFLLRPTAPDNIVLLADNSILQINELHHNNDNIMIKGNEWKVKKSIYQYPVDSSIFNMWECHTDLGIQTKIYNITMVVIKLVGIQLEVAPGHLVKYVVPL